MADNSFSFIDQLRPCLHTCFPCFGQRSSNSAEPAHHKYFPDSDHRGLLEEEEEGDEEQGIHSAPHSEYQFQSNSQLSRWDLLISWLSSKTSSSSKPTRPFDVDDLQTSALSHNGEADALLLDDISIALRARSSSRRMSTKSKSNAPTLHQPQPIPSPSVTSNHRRKSRNPEPNSSTPNQHGSRSLSSAPVKKKDTRSLVEDPQQKSLKDLASLSSTSHPKRSKSRSKSSKQSSSAYTDETVDSEPRSVPSLITSRTTTTTSSSIPSSDRLELNVEIIKFIHQNYNQECRRLYGRDLSRLQIQQLCEYLISRRFNDPIGPRPGPSSPATGAMPAEPDDKKRQAETDDPAKENQTPLSDSTPSRPSLEIESLKRIQLSSTEFLQAIKQTKTSHHHHQQQQQQQLHPSETDDSETQSLMEDPIEVELDQDQDLFLSSSLLDWFTKGSQLTSDILNNLSVNQSPP
ncbi:hypothetical protein PGT21_031093 [Puccinia graminis f. sp. tritici]|uniref:Uncharacterized protein n=1 Tax=Puccinia graminis f. sp. tritici TaxID=56615 RepID=A0A5B0LNG5_PUCGR|nr:hypothetical protein PGT21_031093 [Puccinia graminis f. sp. tritici]KAA1081924.1 hypothetical protein PGTUg99_028997 [Puccinia graminis f. sp. tritici]